MEFPISLWVGFHILVFIMLGLDLGVFNKKDHEISLKESLGWTAVWIVVAMCFNVWVYFHFGQKEAFEFLTGYVLEKSLSVDNIFVMTIIFNSFKVPAKYQHRVLFWGILGALAMRIVFIVGGVALVHKFDWILYFFGAFLVFTGVKMMVAQDNDEEMNPEDSFIFKFARKYLPVSEDSLSDKFFVKKDNRWLVTPLFLVLLIIESTDVIFAVDSIPAILSVTTSAFIAYTSNVFAILGLRSLYFAFASLVRIFAYLSYALSVILVFIGVKMLVAKWFHIPADISVIIVCGLLGVSVVASIIFPPKDETKE